MHMSPPDYPKALSIQVDASIVDATILEEFGGDPYDLSILSLYLDHAAKHV